MITEEGEPQRGVHGNPAALTFAARGGRRSRRSDVPALLHYSRRRAGRPGPGLPTA